MGKQAFESQDSCSSSNPCSERPDILLQVVSFKCGGIDLKHTHTKKTQKNGRVISGIDFGRCALKPLRNFSNCSLLNFYVYYDAGILFAC